MPASELETWLKSEDSLLQARAKTVGAERVLGMKGLLPLLPKPVNLPERFQWMEDHRDPEEES